MSTATVGVNNDHHVSEIATEGDNNSATSNCPSLYTTEIVRSLFGAAIGAVWKEGYACSLNRHAGRLYVASNAICFYSNIFGYERKALIFFPQVIQIAKTKNTSLLVRYRDDDDTATKVFRSFADRDVVLHLLTNVMRHSNLHEDDCNLPAMQPMRRRCSSVPTLKDESLTELGHHSRCHSSDRLSDDHDENNASSTLRKDQSVSTGGDEHEHVDQALTDKLSSSEIHNTMQTLDSHDDPMAPQQQGVEEEESSFLFAKAKNKANALKEIAVQSLHLPISSKEFYAKFLATDAPFSMETFQRETIGDLDINTSSWHAVSSPVNNNVLERVMKFKHLNHSSLGPKEVRTTRNMTCSIYEFHGLSLEATTVVEGIPGADCFRLEECWILEQMKDDDDGVLLTVRFESIFTKTFLLRKVIESKTRHGTLHWFAAYVTMLQRACQEDADDDSFIKVDAVNDIVKIDPIKEKTRQSLLVPTCTLSTWVVILLFFVGIVCALTLLYSIWIYFFMFPILISKMDMLQNEMMLMRRNFEKLVNDDE